MEIDSTTKDLQIEEIEEQEIEQENGSLFGFFGHTGPVFTTRFHPKKEGIITSGGEDDRVYAINAGLDYETKSLINEWSWNPSNFKDSVIFSEFSRVPFEENDIFHPLAVADMSGDISIYSLSLVSPPTMDVDIDPDAKNDENDESKEKVIGERIHFFESPGSSVEWINWHPKGSVLLAGFEDGSIWMWRITLKKAVVLQVFYGHGGRVTAGSFSNSGKWLASIGEDSSLRIWDPKTGASKTSVTGPYFHGNNPIISMAIDPSNTLIATGDAFGNVCITLAEKGTVIHRLPGVFKDSVEGLAWSKASSNNSSILVGVSMDGSGIIWSITKTARVSFKIKNEDRSGFTQLSWPEGEHFFYTGSVNSQIKQWDSRTGECKRELKGHTSPILSIDISDSLKSLVSGDEDGNVYLFSLLDDPDILIT